MKFPIALGRVSGSRRKHYSITLLKPSGFDATKFIEFTANSYPADNDCQMKLRPQGLRKTELRLAWRPPNHECARARDSVSLTCDLPASPPLPGRRIAGDGSRPVRPPRCNKHRVSPGNPSSGCSSANLPA